MSTAAKAMSVKSPTGRGQCQRCPGRGAADLTPELLDESRAYNNWQIGLRGDTTTPALAEAMREFRDVLKDELQRLLPQVDERALRTLKFAELLPASLAVSTLAERNSDHAGASVVAARPVASRVIRDSGS